VGSGDVRTLGDRRRWLEHRLFVGRREELALLRGLLRSRAASTQVVWIHGPGGIGKTTLLAELEGESARAGVACVRVDARHLEPAPEAFLAALGRALGRTRAGLWAALRRRRHVLLVDHWENVQSLDAWLRADFVPGLPERTLLVTAGRNPPSVAWRADPGARTLPLRNLSPDESRRLLRARGVRDDELAAALRFTHGHPLALALVADVARQRPGSAVVPAATADVVGVLLEQLVRDALPAPEQWAAIYACALVRTMTEPLLAAMLEVRDAGARFRWLERLSFVEATAGGLVPHDLAREVLAADLDRRNPELQEQLIERAHGHYRARLARSRAADEQRQIISDDFFFLARRTTAFPDIFEVDGADHVRVAAATPEDVPVLVAQVRRHEGGASARLAARWLRRQLDGAQVVREGGELSSFLVAVRLDAAAADDVRADPATRLVWQHLRRRAPLRPGELCYLFRFHMSVTGYQTFNPSFNRVGVLEVQHMLTTPRLAYVANVFADPDAVEEPMRYAGAERLGDFVVGGRRYGAFAIDLRQVPPQVWLEKMFGKRRGHRAEPAPVAPHVLLSRQDFAAAVRAALRALGEPRRLAENPLCRSRLVDGVDGVGPETAPARLRGLIQEAALALRGARHGEEQYRTLDLTYLRPAPGQKQAAAQLGMAFGTYRRHLAGGVEALSEGLWQRELGAML
jgi:hypothetical protein